MAVEVTDIFSLKFHAKTTRRRCQISVPSPFFPEDDTEFIHSLLTILSGLLTGQAVLNIWIRNIKIQRLLISWLIRLQGTGEYKVWKYWSRAILWSSTGAGRGRSKADRPLGTRLHYLCCPQSKSAPSCHLGLQNSNSTSAQNTRPIDQNGRLSKRIAPFAFKMRTTQMKGLAMLRPLANRAVRFNNLPCNSYKT